MKKFLCLLFCVVLMFSMAACSTTGSESCEAAVDLYAKILACNISEDEYELLCPESVWELSEEQGGKSLEESYAEAKSAMETQRKVAADVFGENFVVTYKILGQQDASAEDTAALKKLLTEKLQIDAESIGRCCTVNVLFKISGDLDEKEQEIPVSVLEIDSAWYLADIFTEFI